MCEPDIDGTSSTDTTGTDWPDDDDDDDVDADILDVVAKSATGVVLRLSCYVKG